MTRTPIIDSHVHLWNRRHPSLRWDWLDPQAVHPILGNIDGIKSTGYEAENLWAEARFADVAAFVHVEAALGSPDPVEETRWLTEMARRTGHPAALVAHVDLGGEDAVPELDGHQESPLMRGVRDFATEAYLTTGTTTRNYEASLTELSRRGLVLDLDCEWPHMAAARELADRHPELVIVLEHIGYPRRRDAEYFAGWRHGITELARAENVLCKVSGVAMTDPHFTRESLEPWVVHSLESFGPDRCMIGSNWPVDRLFSSYDVIMNLYRDFVASLSADEQVQVLHDNAAATFRIPPGHA
ncbi:amidohydrolase family protein [Pseudonocardia sp. GCM10023141]|uniref:amidohydrolase family protein n=1 Tax=Pseudonocardia sp. GCM10023141 TaxID=3252653 RepID=UPI00361C47FC